MNLQEIIKLFHDFERYDRQTEDYVSITSKPQRFNRYLSKQILAFDTLQQILADNDIEVMDADSVSIDEHETQKLNTMVQYYFKFEKRTSAA